MDVRAQPCVVTIDEIDGKRYKLLYFYEADEWELYNLTDDIGEKRNLAKEMPDVSASLSRKFRPGFLKNIRLGSQNTLSVKKTALQSYHGSYDLVQITR